jgi:hypothetical protein
MQPGPPNQPYNPYAPPAPGVQGAFPQAPYGPQAFARVDGEHFVVANGSHLPALCVKCGSNGPLETRKMVFTYVPPWARLFGALIMLAVQKKSTFLLPICRPCNGVWRKWNFFAFLGLVLPMLAIGLVMLVLVVALNLDPGVLFVAVPAGLIGMIVVFLLRKKHVVLSTKVDKVETWLRGVHEHHVRMAVMQGR